MSKEQWISALRAIAKTALAVLLTVACVTSLTAGTIHAQSRPPRPKPTPVPTATPAPIPTSVPTPLSFTVSRNVPDNFAVHISPATSVGDAELLSGPTIDSPVTIALGAGVVSFLRLSEDSDYVFRYRNKIWVPSTGSFIFSPWVQFSFRTPTFDSLRPAAPQNVRVIAQTDTTVTVGWDAVPTAVRYDFSLNGGPFMQTGTCNTRYCTPPSPLTATFPRPAAGTSVSFSVTATKEPLVVSPPPYPLLDSRFITSLPTTITVSN